MSSSSPSARTSNGTPSDSQSGGVLRALERLDALLERAIAATNVASAEGPATDFFRGLRIRPEDVERALTGQPGRPFFLIPPGSERVTLAHDVPEFLWLGETFGLAGFDLDVMLLALAPELDVRYERLYGYLQDDVTRKRPTVDLALNLFSSDASEKLALRARLAPDAPLIRNGLVRLLPDPSQVQPPLATHSIKPDEQILRLLLGGSHLDLRLADFARLTDPALPEAACAFEGPDAEPLLAVALQAHRERRALRLYFEGPDTAGKEIARDAVARALGMRVLNFNVTQALEAIRNFPSVLRVMFREAWLVNAVLFLNPVDALRRGELSGSFQEMVEQLAIQPGVTILSGTEPWLPPGPALGMLTLHFGVLASESARRLWEKEIERHGVKPELAHVQVLADRFRLTSNQIADAAASAVNRARWRTATGNDSAGAGFQFDLDDLCAAARDECGHSLRRLARRIVPRSKWGDLVLPDDQLEQLYEVCNQAKYRGRVFADWGFDRRLSLGKGLNVLFSGPPGTGKTMAAEVIAGELRLDLYKIDLSQVVSKYIGETEKNLDRIFCAAENSNAILFFDEADTLFGKRSEVKDSHDRYANIEIGYLLQKMEEYDGIAILATNVKHHIDEAFVRRMQAIVEFPFPEEGERRRVWQTVFPLEAPLAADVDFAVLARSVRLAGGNIKNIARLAAFLAAADGGVISMPHLMKASRREYQKLGRTWNENEWSLEPAITALH